jgi:trk system potassium uptake protein TrkA
MKQFAIIGLGNFGYYLATELYNKGHQVLAIDNDSARVQEIKDHVSQAAIADSTDIKALEALGIREMDTVIVCIGELISNSVLTTMNVKDLGVKTVYAKAVSDAHGRILDKIGVDGIFFPERDLAITAAEKMNNPNMLDFLAFSKDYSIIQIAPPEKFIGQSLKELDLRNAYDVQVIAIRESIPENLIVAPNGEYRIKDSDTLTLLGPNKALAKLR